MPSALLLVNRSRPFDFSYRDKDKVYHEERNLTPLDFYHQYVEGSLRDYVAIVNEPTEIMPLNKPIQFHGVENMVGRDMLALNLPQKEMEALCVKQLEAGDALVCLRCWGLWSAEGRRLGS